MSIHIGAKKHEIAPFVILTGDPLRASHMAQAFLTAPQRVSKVRGMEFWSGSYKGSRVTIGTSGMGFGSIGIIANELFTEYEVEVIVRVGTTGSYLEELTLEKIVLVESCFSFELEFADNLGVKVENNTIFSSPKLTKILENSAQKVLGTRIQKVKTHSTNTFYYYTKTFQELASQSGSACVEMESFALFATAQKHGKPSSTLLTVSDELWTNKSMSAEERQMSVKTMFEIALDAAKEWEMLQSKGEL